jgi:RimJ/RimL family protein N-acetyltransferase
VVTLLLRNYRAVDDRQILHDLRSDVALQHCLLAHPDPGAPVDVDAWVQRRESHGWFRVIEVNAVDAAGFVQLCDFHRLNRHAWAGIAVHPRWQGRGWGRKAMLALAVEAVTNFNLHKLMLHVRADNLAALQLYSSLGYRTVGYLCQHYHDGETYHDVVVLEVLLKQS